MRAALQTVQSLSEREFALSVHSLGDQLNGSQKALKERGIDKMLEEARADNKENDAAYLKPSIRPSCAYSLYIPESRAHCPIGFYAFERCLCIASALMAWL